MGKEGKVVIRRTINDSFGFRFSSPFQYLRRMAEFSAQVPAAAVRFLGVSINARNNGVIWTVQPYIEGTHPHRRNSSPISLPKAGVLPVPSTIISFSSTSHPASACTMSTPETSSARKTAP